MTPRPVKEERPREEPTADGPDDRAEPERLAGDFTPDPWDVHPERWRETAPWPS